MATPSSVIHVAQGYLGYTEYPRGSNRTKFGAWYGINPAPWCAMFVSYCFYAAGMPLKIDTSKGFAYCPDGVHWFKAHGLWHPSSQSKPGDLIFFDWNGDGVSDHVGIVEAGWNGSYTSTIEGNTGSVSQNNGGEVMRQHRDASRTTMGVGRPNWAAVPTPTPAPSGDHAPAWPGRVLALTSPLMHGNDVYTWQHRMQQRGWRISADGVYGSGSRAVCIAFQREKGLAADGKVGPMTWYAAWSAPVT